MRGGSGWRLAGSGRTHARTHAHTHAHTHARDVLAEVERRVQRRLHQCRRRWCSFGTRLACCHALIVQLSLTQPTAAFNPDADCVALLRDIARYCALLRVRYRASRVIARYCALFVPHRLAFTRLAFAVATQPKVNGSNRATGGSTFYIVNTHLT